MKVRHTNGSVVNVPLAKADNLARTGNWTYAEPRSERLSELVSRELELDPKDDLAKTAEDALGLSQPQEEPPYVAGIPEMRAWALKEGIEGVKEKGKLSRQVVEAYQKAHTEE